MGAAANATLAQLQAQASGSLEAQVAALKAADSLERALQFLLLYPGSELAS